MNKFFLFLLLLCFTHSIMGQTEEKKDSVLQGRICDVVRLFPLTNDVNFKNSQYSVVYPLLMVNNVPIEDKKK